MVDRFLSEHVQPDGTVTLKKLLARPGPEGRNCVARLQTLTDLKLAVEERPGVWRLAGGWKESLARLGEQNDRIERLYPIVGEKAVGYQFVDPKLPVSNFGAVVVGKGLHDELSGEMFVAVQATHGQGYYIPLRPEVAESLHRGDTIRVGFKAEAWLKPADRAIAQVAKENGGVYAPREHQRELETKQPTKSDADALSPANLVAGNIRRLERLVAYGLASQLPDGRWRVPSDLVAQLESRERTHSRPRLQIDKVSPPQRETCRASHHRPGKGTGDDRREGRPTAGAGLRGKSSAIQGTAGSGAGGSVRNRIRPGCRLSAPPARACSETQGRRAAAGKGRDRLA